MKIHSQDKVYLSELVIGNCDTLKLPHYSENFNWISGNQDIANVDNNGVVCGIHAGSTSITAVSKISNRSYQFNIRVVSNENLHEENIRYDAKVGSTICKESRIILNKLLKEQGERQTDSRLGVSENGRYLIIKETNTPLIFISQTLWSMTRRLSREQIIEILDICVNQGFTSIQLIAHSHYMGENRYGDIPFHKENFLCPIITEGNDNNNESEYDWWDHLEFIIEECIKRELIVCLLPTWREQWDQKSNLNVNNAFAYGRFIGSRYRHLNEWIIWIMGGDAAPDNEIKLAINRELAKGISIGVNKREFYGNLMMSYHTYGPSMTNSYFSENEEFMDFNTIQSGQGLDRFKGMIGQSWKTQHKPTIDFEPFYDKNGELQNETRTTIISGIFSGGFGTSYGNWNIWHCGALNDAAKFAVPESFENSYGAHIKHVKKILTPHFIKYRIPDQDVLINRSTLKEENILANTSSDSSFVYVYSARGEHFTVDLDYINGNLMNCWWFDPRNGKTGYPALITKENKQKKFIPPSNGDLYSGNDWILILERK